MPATLFSVMLLVFFTPTVCADTLPEPARPPEMNPVSSGVRVIQAMETTDKVMREIFPEAYPWYTQLSFEYSDDGNIRPAQIISYVPGHYFFDPLTDEILNKRADSIVKRLVGKGTCSYWETGDTSMDDWMRWPDEEVVKFTIFFNYLC